jgi:transcriptional regulator with GAF, ATPase, and Fis domain
VLDGVRVRDAYARVDSSVLVGNSTLRVRLTHDVVELPLSSRERFGGLIGKSVAMRLVFTLLERVVSVDDTILVEGETGTGKELVAEAIHEESQRVGGPFIVFDCSAVAATLLESELFGHVRGAFSGALANREGAFEAAEGGTLFLDEVGELPLELQPKLLRALERFEVRPLGSNVHRRVDVRVVAATNRNLSEEVAKGRFREDLYYRLAVLRVELPPLRERPEDIPLLIEHFTKQLSGRARGPGAASVGALPDKTVRAMMAEAWPGNVRELRNAVARALSVGAGAHTAGARRDANRPGASASTVEAEVDLSVPLKASRDRFAESFEEAYLRIALRETGGNVSHAARMAGVNRKFVQRAIQRFGLRASDED